MPSEILYQQSGIFKLPDHAETARPYNLCRSIHRRPSNLNRFGTPPRDDQRENRPTRSPLTLPQVAFLVKEPGW